MEVIRADHDAWFQDAMCVVTKGHWPRTKYETFAGDDFFADLSIASEALREAAGSGKITIWGKQHRMRLYEAIAPDFWINNQVGSLSVFGGPEEIKTEQITGRSGSDPQYEGDIILDGPGHQGLMKAVGAYFKS